MTLAARTLEIDERELVDIIRQTARSGLKTWLRVRGSSMQPVIPHRGEVLIRARNEDVVRCGDVVLAVAVNGLPVIHRVVRVDGRQVHLKGDHCVWTDPPIPLEQIVGVVEAVRSGGRVHGIGRRPPFSVRFFISRWYGHLRRRLRHG
jgi:hypothetical protein